MPSFAPRLESLPPAQRALWPHLAPARGIGLVLYGGTAVALRCGNRESLDFDFFGKPPLDKDALRRVLPVVESGVVLQDAPDTLTVATNGVKLSFFGVDVEYLVPPDTTDDGVLMVASPTDLLAHKLKVILQRAESRDYSDIAALLDYGVPLHVGLAGARRLFGRQFQPAESLKALTYFGDGDLASVGPATRTLLRAAVDAVQGHGRQVFENTTAQEPPVFCQHEQDPYWGL